MRFGYGRPIILIGSSRRFAAPSWAIRILQAGSLIMAAGVALIVAILAYAVVSIVFGVG